MRPVHVTMIESALRGRQEKNRRYSLRAFAKFLGVHPSSLSRILSGKQVLSVPAATRIIRKLKMDREDRERFMVSLALQKKQTTLAALREPLDAAGRKGALTESEERYFTLVDLLDLVDQTISISELVRNSLGEVVDARMLRVNRRWLESIGVSEKVVTGKRMSEWIPKSAPKLAELYARVLKSGQPERSEQYLPDLDQWYDVVVVPVEEDRCMSVGTHITDRKKREKELDETIEKLQSITDILPDLIWRSEPDGTTTWYNRRWYDYSGKTPEESIGWGWLDTIHPNDREATAAMYKKAVENGEILEREHRVRNANGEYRWFLVRACPTFDEKGRLRHVYGAATDVHHLKKK